MERVKEEKINRKNVKALKMRHRVTIKQQFFSSSSLSLKGTELGEISCRKFVTKKWRRLFQIDRNRNNFGELFAS